jgi:uncharacterized membrane protein YczE
LPVRETSEPGLLDTEISQRFRLEGTIIVIWSTAWLRRVEVWGEPLTARRLAIYLTGCLIFALGSDFFIASNLGTDPLDVFVLGLRKHIPMTIGMGQGGVAVICIIIWAAWDKKKPIFSPFFTFAFCGSIIDLLQLAKTAQASGLHPIVLMLLAGVMCAYGSAMIIMSGIGIRAMDLVAISTREHLRWPFWIGKSSCELLLLIVGSVLGGPVGVGTIYFLASVDLLIQPLIIVNARCGMRNLGLAPRELVVGGSQ